MTTIESIQTDIRKYTATGEGDVFFGLCTEDRALIDAALEHFEFPLKSVTAQQVESTLELAHELYKDYENRFDGHGLRRGSKKAIRLVYDLMDLELSDRDLLSLSLHCARFENKDLRDKVRIRVLSAYKNRSFLHIGSFPFEKFVIQDVIDYGIDENPYWSVLESALKDETTTGSVLPALMPVRNLTKPMMTRLHAILMDMASEILQKKSRSPEDLGEILNLAALTHLYEMSESTAYFLAHSYRYSDHIRHLALAMSILVHRFGSVAMRDIFKPTREDLPSLCDLLVMVHMKSPEAQAIIKANF